MRLLLTAGKWVFHKCRESLEPWLLRHKTCITTFSRSNDRKQHDMHQCGTEMLHNSHSLINAENKIEQYQFFQTLKTNTIYGRVAYDASCSIWDEDLDHIYCTSLTFRFLLLHARSTRWRGLLRHNALLPAHASVTAATSPAPLGGLFHWGTCAGAQTKYSVGVWSKLFQKSLSHSHAASYGTPARDRFIWDLFFFKNNHKIRKCSCSSLTEMPRRTKKQTFRRKIIFKKYLEETTCMKTLLMYQSSKKVHIESLFLQAWVCACGIPFQSGQIKQWQITTKPFPGNTQNYSKPFKRKQIRWCDFEKIYIC